MPLTERDINTHHEIPRNKRHSIQSDLAYTRLKDENSPSLRGGSSKTTAPPSQRLLAPTKASAAKVTCSPRAGPSSPQQQSHSKLPRRTTPTSTSKWGARIAERGGSAERTAAQAGDLHKHPADIAATHQDQLAREPSDRSVQDSTQDKPLPADKPLPSRPVASIITAMSPSKSSRTLLDASERPLTISVAGCEHVWPALTPSTAHAAVADMSKDDTEKQRDRLPTSQNASIFNTVGADHYSASDSTNAAGRSSYNATAFLQSVPESERSSSDTFVSVSDANNFRQSMRPGFQETSEEPHPGASSGYAQHLTTGAANVIIEAPPPRSTAHPARKASLRYQGSRDGLDVSLLGSRDGGNGLNSATQYARTVTPDSRPHSPSPASFSRPRPSSISHGRSMPSPTPAAASASTPMRAQKTASRIPIPDSKKAMLVDVKSRRSSGTVTPKSEHGPSYGSRRLDAPDALKILDQGVKRRQLKRSDIMGTAMTSTSTATKASTAVTFPDQDRSSTSTPDHTFATSSSEEEEIITPTYKPHALTRSDFPDFPVKNADHHTNSYYHGAAIRLFDGAVTALANTPPPPSTSAFTGPLQTIHSQAVLPTFQQEQIQPPPSHSRQPSDLDTFKQRLSELHRAHTEYTGPLIGDRAPAPESTRFSLMELLNEYAREDALLARDGENGLDFEAKKHITRTLSLLEGKGSPPKTEVDNETLLSLFGHLKRGLERVPKTASFIDNAAAAEKFLAQADNSRASAAGGAHVKANVADGGDQLRTASGTPQLPPIEQVASKWSDSTTSLHGLSPISEGVSPRHTNAPKTEKPLPPPKRLPPDPPRSIGYPSRIPSKANVLIGPGASSAPASSVFDRDASSPTTGKRTPGSVRAARETLQQVRGGFARTTASAESKKTAKMPTPNTRQFDMSGESKRGRVPSAERPRAGLEATADMKTPRARSKSRYVLDKLNGLFSAKREKRSSTMPSVPAVAELEASSRNVEVTPGGSPVMRPARGPPVTKMPTMSPSEHPAMRSASSAGTTTSIETPVDSVIAFDDPPQSAKSLQEFSAGLISKAKREKDMARKERLLTFAKVLNDSLISAREVQISSEIARRAANDAQASFEMTQKSLAMLQRLAVSLNSRR